MLVSEIGRAADPVCVLVSGRGKVEVSRQGTTAWTAAQSNQELKVGDRIRTGLKSRATLRWSNQSDVELNQLTTLEIAPPPAGGNVPQGDLKSGGSYFFNREPSRELQFRTPTVSGAVVGTEFNLAVLEDGRTEVTLINGQVALSNAQDRVMLASGQQATVAAGQAPEIRPVLDAVNIIQWVLYYPLILDPADLKLTKSEQESLRASLEAYGAGDLLRAAQEYPANRQPASSGERVYLAALTLGVGQVAEAQALLRDADAKEVGPLVAALHEVVAAVKFQTADVSAAPATGSGHLARSYYLQSRSDLNGALAEAKKAVDLSPEFGPAWVHLAELEFSFGRISDARQALERGLSRSPRHAPGAALEGFLAAAQSQYAQALVSFDRAIALDGSLANAWLGRGLVRIHEGQEQEGREDLLVAAAREPQRSILRSYLGKAYHHEGDETRAHKELLRARELDPRDPTPWLYAALLHQQENRINDAVRDLETSKDLNENRSVFRSQLLLDQDQAVRGANLAAVYRDAGMTDVGVREATRAVNYDYGNFASHLFLANSYDSLRDPKLINLRYETPWYSELLLANLLAPVGAGNLSQAISQQEYSRLFDQDHLGGFSSTEYLSSGDWIQAGSQFGNIGHTGYSLDAYYRTENGQRPNNDLEQLSLAARVKQEITDKDSIFFQAQYFESEGGDLAQYYNQQGTLPGVPAPDRDVRVKETQEPNLLAGYHREWGPGMHTLFLGGRFEDTLKIRDDNPELFFVTFDSNGPTPGAPIFPITQRDYKSDLVAYSAELQQIWQTPSQTLVVGGRYQNGSSDTDSHLEQPLPTLPGITLEPLPDQSVETDLYRVSAYAYEQWQVHESLRLIAGVSYDRVHYPRNIDTSPVTDDETTEDQFSPKAGFIWSPWRKTYVRGVYTRSLGGAFFDSSVRLEPTQVAGFNQSFRSLIPESVAGLVSGTEFETWGAALDHTFDTGTYVGVEGEYLTSDAHRSVGMIIDPAIADLAGISPLASARQSLKFDEKSIVFTVNQLLARDWAIGARYKITDADLDQHYLGLVGDIPFNNQDVEATLHQVRAYLLFQHPCGFFGQFDGVWSQQSNRGYSPDIPGDDFWQFNLSGGYRFWQRRAEVAVALLNLADQNYRLNPLTLHAELPRERTLAVRLKLLF